MEQDDILGSLQPEAGRIEQSSFEELCLWQDPGKRRAKVLSGSELFSRIDKVGESDACAKPVGDVNISAYQLCTAKNLCSG